MMTITRSNDLDNRQPKIRKPAVEKIPYQPNSCIRSHQDKIIKDVACFKIQTNVKLKTLFQQTAHDDPEIRKEAFEGIKDHVRIGTCLWDCFPKNEKAILVKTCRGIIDPDLGVREVAYTLLLMFKGRTKFKKYVPTLLIPNVVKALGHPVVDIHLTGRKVCDLLVQQVPSCLHLLVRKLFECLRDMMENGMCEEQFSHIRILQGVDVCLRAMPSADVDEFFSDGAVKSALSIFPCNWNQQSLLSLSALSSNDVVSASATTAKVLESSSRLPQEDKSDPNAVYNNFRSDIQRIDEKLEGVSLGIKEEKINTSTDGVGVGAKGFSSKEMMERDKRPGSSSGVVLTSFGESEPHGIIIHPDVLTRQPASLPADHIPSSASLPHALKFGDMHFASDLGSVTSQDASFRPRIDKLLFPSTRVYWKTRSVGDASEKLGFGKNAPEKLGFGKNAPEKLGFGKEHEEAGHVGTNVHSSPAKGV